MDGQDTADSGEMGIVRIVCDDEQVDIIEDLAEFCDVKAQCDGDGKPIIEIDDEGEEARVYMGLSPDVRKFLQFLSHTFDEEGDLTVN